MLAPPDCRFLDRGVRRGLADRIVPGLSVPFDGAAGAILSARAAVIPTDRLPTTSSRFCTTGGMGGHADCSGYANRRFASLARLGYPQVIHRLSTGYPQDIHRGIGAMWLGGWGRFLVVVLVVLLVGLLGAVLTLFLVEGLLAILAYP